MKETRETLYAIKEEFYTKKYNLISVFQKIKNTKYFAIISQLLTKIDYES
jgi:acyl-ACP thioesterase